MNSTDFVIRNIDRLVEKIPYLQVRYEYSAFDKSHYIEVLPQNTYLQDGSYISFEQEFRREFVNYFPFECLVFLSEGSLYEIENPMYLKKGTNFIDSIHYVFEHGGENIKAKHFVQKTNNIFEQSSANLTKFKTVVNQTYEQTTSTILDSHSNFALAA